TRTPTPPPATATPTFTPTRTPTAGPPTATATPTFTPTRNPIVTPTPPAPTPTPTPSIPAAPSNLTAAASSSSTITIAWTDNSNNETAFRVERAPAAAGPWTYIGATTLTGYGDTGLAASTPYYYRVAAYNTAGTSAYSNTASATTWPTIPGAPSRLPARGASSSRIDLSWTDNSSNESGFKIERSGASGGPWSQIATSTVASYSDTGIAPSTTCYYRIRAYNTSGDSAYSNTDSATTLAVASWSKWYQGSGDDMGRSVALDGSGNVVVAGHYQGIVDFGTGPMTSYTPSGSGPTVEGFVAEYSASGTPVFARG